MAERPEPLGAALSKICLGSSEMVTVLGQGMQQHDNRWFSLAYWARSVASST